MYSSTFGTWPASTILTLTKQLSKESSKYFEAPDYLSVIHLAIELDLSHNLSPR